MDKALAFNLMEHQNTVEIAVLKEQINGLREQAKNHAETTNRKIEELSSIILRLSAEITKLNTTATVGWRTICVIGAIVGSVITLSLSIARYFKGVN